MKRLEDDAPISTHYIQTKKVGWKEVEKQDRFFAKNKINRNTLSGKYQVCFFVLFYILKKQRKYYIICSEKEKKDVRVKKNQKKL